jgi:4-hydroxyphenylacetate 3-monooxygenase
MTAIGNTPATGIRTGAQYLKGLQDGRDIWTKGAKVADVTTEPGMGRGAATLASFLDRQHEAQYQDTVTYVDEDGVRCQKSYQIPKSVDDILDRGKAYYQWATWSHGMFGRTPDYKNASVMSFAAADSFLAKGTLGQADFAANMQAFYKDCRQNDKVLTHTLVNPSVNHAQAAAGIYNDSVALHVVKETDAGIIVKGARLLATLGPFADEIEVFPSMILKSDPANIPFAFAFAIPINTPGLKMICRDSYDHGQSTFDAPLSSRFEEMDAVVIFDNVRVPWERVFMYGQPELCNVAFNETNSALHMMHQVACGKLAKAEFLTGILCAMLRATGRDKDMAMKGIVSEVMMMTETVRALLYQGEHEAHEDQYGNFVPLRRPLDTSRNLFPKFYPRMLEIIQNMGSSSLMATPSDADFSNALSEEIEKYFQVANLDARDRVALYRLAHDVAVSGFGNRQALYERFFFGPPHLLHAAYFDLYDKERVIGRVNSFLNEG